MAKKFRLAEVSDLKDRSVFFDANVLIYLFWPTGRQTFEAYYANAFARLLRQQNTFFVDFSVISEIINRAIQTEYSKYLLTHSLSKNDFKYKDYRNSADGQEALKDIYLVVEQQILNRFEVKGKIYTEDTLKKLLVVDELDFVDKSIVDICRENNFVLLTNDKDFRDTNIDILSCNKHLFRT